MKLEMATAVNRSSMTHGSVRQFVLGLYGLFLGMALAGCSIPLSYYDSTTYSNLTSLKAETSMLIETFDKRSFSQNESKIEATTLNLRKAHEYEKGKGTPNSDTAKQFEHVVKLYGDTINEYRDHGPGKLGPKYFQEAARVLGQAFDIVIQTENLKNKDKR
jgi:hypothetical protein